MLPISLTVNPPLTFYLESKENVAIKGNRNGKMADNLEKKLLAPEQYIANQNSSNSCAIN